MSSDEINSEVMALNLRIQQSESWDQLAQICVQGITEVCSAVVVRWLEYNGGGNRPIWSCAASSVSEETALGERQQEWESIDGLEKVHQRIKFLATTKTDQVFSMRAEMFSAELEESSYYKNCMKPIGVHDILAIQCYYSAGTQADEGSRSKQCAVVLCIEIPEGTCQADCLNGMKYVVSHIRAACGKLMKLATSANLIKVFGGLRQHTDESGLCVVCPDGTRLWDVDDIVNKLVKAMGGFCSSGGLLHMPPRLREWTQSVLQTRARICAQNEANTKVFRTWDEDRVHVSLYLAPIGQGGIMVCKKLQSEEREASGERGAAEDEIHFSERQLDVLRVISAGMTSQEAADALGIKKRTVDKHLENIYAKLGVGNRVAAVNCYQTHMSGNGIHIVKEIPTGCRKARGGL